MNPNAPPLVCATCGERTEIQCERCRTAYCGGCAENSGAWLDIDADGKRDDGGKYNDATFIYWWCVSCLSGQIKRAHRAEEAA